MATTTTTMPPVNLDQNVVTIVLILGMSIGIMLIYALYKLIPKLRSGEVSFGKIDFDWRAELLNDTPKKEKARLAEEKARREEEKARREEELAVRQGANAFDEGEAQPCHPNEPLSPHVATVTTEKGAQEDVFASDDNRETR